MCLQKLLRKSNSSTSIAVIVSVCSSNGFISWQPAQLQCEGHVVLINEAEAFCFAIYCAVIPHPEHTAELSRLSDIYMRHGAARAAFTPSLYVNVMIHLCVIYS